MSRREQQPLEIALNEMRDAIALFWRRNGYPPTVRDVADIADIKINYASKLIPFLIRTGVAVRSSRHGLMLSADAERIKGALRGTSWR